ncbi:hypothetical protein [Pseudonocardia thermophila]|uniref:hypothetical protein n=1 Tax=Pseudonocardia thermophila TaxID=1848 RepID=UPI000937AB9C|nr:hypothetical protein [Pseudonocardia thermophila]
MARTATVPAQRTSPRRAQQRTAQQRAGQQRVGRPSTATTRVGGDAAPKPKKRAAERAYQRRDDRLRRLGNRWSAARANAAPGRAPFVLLVMVLLAAGLVAILWLSTAAAADSYRLTDARAAAQRLQEQSEALRREVAAMESAPEIARRAEQLGMVAVRDPARLVVAPDGAVTVVGQPRAAVAPAPPAPPAPAGDDQPAPGAEGATEGTEGQPPAEGGENATPENATPESADPEGAGAGGSPAQEQALSAQEGQPDQARQQAPEQQAQQPQEQPPAGAGTD